jgi:NAD(P)-dependent dehydrogenase (short-subunit alcohol dehydrogenase family)
MQIKRCADAAGAHMLVLSKALGKSKPPGNLFMSPAAGSPDDWDKQTQINLMTPMRLTRLVLPGMKQRGEGHVVNIASIEALYPYPSAPAYSATKWGLRGWSKALFAVRASMDPRLQCTALLCDSSASVSVSSADVGEPHGVGDPSGELAVVGFGGLRRL